MLRAFDCGFRGQAALAAKAQVSIYLSIYIYLYIYIYIYVDRKSVVRERV